MNTQLRALYDTVQKRTRPEDVAELIGATLSLSDAEQAVINKATRYSLRRSGYAWSSMADDFERPVSAQKQIASANLIFSVNLSAEDALDMDKVEAFIARVSASIHRSAENLKKLTKAERHARGLYKNQRWYNKRLRMCKHLEDKFRRLVFATRKYQFTRIGKSALATQIAEADFLADVNTACLVAYLAARMSRRSTFTNTSQDRAFDEVSAMLLERCKASSTTRWDVLAHVMPDETVLSHLTIQQRGTLVGRWWNVLNDMASMLEEVSRVSAFNVNTMIVARGNDSSTWNQVAGGWNQARTHWISLLHASGAEWMLDLICPGKVMRLMAADVANWHRATDGSNDALHPDTKVWAALPKPWEVVNGTATCTRETVRAACARYGVDPEGWLGQRKDRTAVETLPTPELVHGVSVGSPALATFLREAGVFSGKTARDPEVAFEIVRDANGFAIHVA